MKIGIYDPYLDDVGGGEKYMMTLASFLAQRYEVDVFWDNPSELEKITQRFSLDLSKIHLKKNIFAPKVSLFVRFLQTRKYDALIVLSDGSIPLVGSKKLFLHIQQPLENMQIDSFLGKVKLSRVTSFFCNSEYTKSFIDKKFAVKSQVIYPPVAVHTKDLDKENTILHVGRFRVMDPVTHAGDYKKQHVMINAFKQMVDNGLKGWNFTLAVSVQEKDGKAFEAMKALAKSYPITFLINKTNEELWESYSKAKIYWHASGFGEDLEHHPEFAEHFGISTVEAMGAGCVPVVINAGGQKEIVTEGEDGFLWNTLGELQDKTKKVAEDSSLMKKISEKAKERALDFSAETFDEEVLAMVQ